MLIQLQDEETNIIVIFLLTRLNNRSYSIVALVQIQAKNPLKFYHVFIS